MKCSQCYQEDEALVLSQSKWLQINPEKIEQPGNISPVVCASGEVSIRKIKTGQRTKSPACFNLV